MIAEDVIARIAPDDGENSKILAVVNKVKSEILKAARAMDLEVEPVLVGSVAKGTHLKDPDIDVFVMFSAETKREDLESCGLKIGIEVLKKYEKRYAEHPYVSGLVDGKLVEIVPCYKIEDPSQKMSAVDRTPFHTNYIVKHLKEEQKKEVRLFKQFLKGIGIYGAEAEIEGFSGYLCELCILYCGSFNELVAKAKNWKKGELIVFDHRKHAKFSDSLIVIDPVDPNRNVGSALSYENFAILVHACREYEKNPKLEFFFPNKPKPESIENLKEIMQMRGTTVLGISFSKPDVISDILFSQLRKAKKVIIKMVERADFRVIAFDFFVNDKIVMLLEFESGALPSAKLHRGPPIWHENSNDFRDKWESSSRCLKGPYIKDGYWYVDIKREIIDAKTLITGDLLSLNLGGHVINSLKKGHEILVGNELLKDEYLAYLTMFFYKKFPWEY